MPNKKAEIAPCLHCIVPNPDSLVAVSVLPFTPSLESVYSYGNKAHDDGADSEETSCLDTCDYPCYRKDRKENPPSEWQVSPYDVLDFHIKIYLFHNSVNYSVNYSTTLT